MRRLLALAAGVAACVLLRLSAQTAAPPQQPPLFRAGVDVVQLDVSVLDKNRRPVKGLTTQDFTVFEDGRPQSIVAFSPVDIPDPIEPPAAWMRDTASDVVTNDLNVRRVVIIVLDDAYMPADPSVSTFAKQIARSVVDHLSPNDLAAVTYTFLGHKQDITNDHRRLLASIDTLVPHPGLPGRPSPFSAERGSSVGPTNVGPPPCSYRGRYRGMAACVIDTLVNAANALQTGPAGRKTLVYISTGVPYDFSMENLDAADDLSGLQELFRTLQEANVNVYAIDPSGLTADGIMGPRLDALRIFAENTGGRATIATNQPWDAVPQIFKENSSYYLLGFRSTNPIRDGRFRKIEVRVDRLDVDVRARRGYYAPTPDNPKSSRTPTIAPSRTEKALNAGMPGGDLPFGAQVAPFAAAGQRQAALAVVIGFREQSPAPRTSQSFEIVTAAFDADWKERGGSRQTVNFTTPDRPTDESRFDVFSRLALAPGLYQVRIAAENNGRTGSVFADVDVPDFAKSPLSVSGLLIATTPSVPGAGRNALADLAPVVPTATREFRPATKVTSFLRVYQGGGKPSGAVRVTATIVDEHSRTNFEQTTFIESRRFGETRAADFQLDLPMSTLELGAHLLTIEVSLGRSMMRREVRFMVR